MGLEMNVQASIQGTGIPKATPARQINIAPGGATPDERLQTARILIIDDEPINVMVLRRHLEVAGYRNITSLSDSTMAIETMLREKPDLLFVDIMMPQVSGLDILRLMQQNKTLSHIPAIVLTASTDPGTRIEALNLGAHDFLQKPIDISELLPRARNALFARQYLHHMENYAQELEKQIPKRTAELDRSPNQIIHCLARAAEFRRDKPRQTS